MYRQLWQLLTPFHKTFYSLIFKAVIYESGQLVTNYTISLIIRFYEAQVGYIAWGIGILALLIYNEMYMRLDNNFDWHIVSKQSHPLYSFIKQTAIRKLMRMNVTWHHHHNSGTLVGKISDGVWKTLEIVDVFSWELIPSTVQAFLSIIPMLYFSPITGVMSLVAMVAFIIITIKGEQEKIPIRETRHKFYDHEWRESVQAVQAHETALLFGQIPQIMDRLSGYHQSIVKHANEEGWLAVYKYNRARIRVLSTIRVVIYIIWIAQLLLPTIDQSNTFVQILKNFLPPMDVPSLIFISVLTERLFGSYWRFARIADRVYRNSEAVKRFMGLMLEPDPVDTGTESVEVKSAPEIVVKNVCFDYGGDYDEEKSALHDVSFTIPSSKTVAVVGPSGSGKTTLVKLLTKLIDFQHGDIDIAGLSIKKWAGEKLRRLFSVVPQGDSIFIFDTTIGENIAFAKTDATIDEIKNAATLAGIHEFILTLKDGYDTMVGERGVRLSGGQKQRIGLARAILADSKILILDEATSAVDSLTEREIQENLKYIMTGKTCLIIAHRLSTIKQADWIIVMEAGRVVEEGTHEALMHFPFGLYHRMVELQSFA